VLRVPFFGECADVDFRSEPSLQRNKPQPFLQVLLAGGADPVTVVVEPVTGCTGAGGATAGRRK
jgi:hypothetical protein